MNKFLIEDKKVSESISHLNYYELNDLMLLIPPYSEDYKNILVPKRFMEIVACHVIAPYLKEDKNYKPPIYLAVEGEPGEGKTAQAIATCTQKGVYVIYISASSLSGSHENDAKEKFQKIYNYAMQLKQNSLVAIIIDDFHKGIVNNDDNVKKTINTNVLVGHMMNIAEHNGSIHIPIILTANELSSVYAPLLRIGRTDIFIWEPRSDEKREIIFSIISSFVTEKDSKKFEHFYKKYSNQNIAFFAQLKNQWRKNILKEQLQKISTFDQLSLSRIDSFIDSYKREITYDVLNNVAESLIKERGI